MNVMRILQEKLTNTTFDPGDELVDESRRSVLKVTVWVAIGLYGIIGSYFLRMMMTEQPH